jgi:hypothetical protein
MSEQQVRLTDKEAMACAKLNFRRPIGRLKCQGVVVVKKREKVKKSFLYA